jgi:hypothetical protein
MRPILSEPSGETYRSLLAFALSLSSRFSLVWRRQLTFDASAHAIAVALVPMLENESETTEWPGTQLIDHTAIVRRYRFSAESMAILASTERLYGWLAPERPEDLALYREDGRCWLASIAHERDAYVDVDADELKALRARVPGLHIR